MKQLQFLCILIVLFSCQQLDEAKSEKIKKSFSQFKSAVTAYCTCTSDSTAKNCDSLNYIANWWRQQIDSACKNHNMLQEWGMDGQKFLDELDSVDLQYYRCKGVDYKRNP
ncbi:MAG TPA: hypothetical protein VII99_01400 [Bacteroidia bacterium]